MSRESLQNNRERILMSLQLATIHCDVPIPFELDALRAQSPTSKRSKPLYKELEFFSHLKELGPSEDATGARFRAFGHAGSGRSFVAEVPRGECTLP